MSLQPYVFFNGTCEEALKYYAELLGGRIEAMVTYGEAPTEEPTPPGFERKIMHAYLKLGDQALQASDAPPDHFEPMKGFYLQLGVAEPGEAERVFGALAEGGEVQMALKETFWAQSFGMLVDRFGVPWMINCNKPS